MGRKLTSQARSGIRKRASQKLYERKCQKKAKMLPTKQDKLQEDNDLDEMEEEEEIDLERERRVHPPRTRGSQRTRGKS
jgi:hypothetical protein